jgi:AcrR family transcriptional regulator
MIQAVTNPLAIRSQEWLANALLLLMEEKEFKDVSVKEIAAKADLSRRTFYRVFETKEDPLIWHLNTLYQEFLAELQARSCRQFEDVLTLYLNFWYRHKHFFELLKRSDLLAFMLNQYLRVFPEVFQIVKGNYPLSKDE